MFWNSRNNKKNTLNQNGRLSNVHSVNCDLSPFHRLQLKRGLFWYGHHPKMHEMVSDRSSRAGNRTDFRNISMRVFFDSNKCETNTKLGRQKCKNVIHFLKSYRCHTKIGKKPFIRYNLIQLNTT